MAQKKTLTKKTTSKAKGKTEAVSDSYHHGDLRSALVNAAVKMLETTSQEELSLRELARTVGVSQAAPYRHFKSKEDLFAAINQQGFEIKFKMMKSAVDKYRSDPKEMLIQCGLAYFQMGLKHPQHFKLMMLSKHCPKPEYPELMLISASNLALLRDIVEIAQKEKVLGAGDPMHFTLQCWALVHGITALYVESRVDWLGLNEQNTEKFLREMLDQYIAGGKSDLTAENPVQLFTTPESLHKFELLKTLSILK